MIDLKQKCNGKRIIAFYLPQFHTIPENDKWWGKGFTEWTNTKKARPLFEGHYQPKTPLNENYYDLSDVSVMVEQAELAKRYGVYGFCYYHYWFKNGKKLLEKPVEQMLDNKDVDIPFCLCWANENWTRNWDGGNHEVIATQEYGNPKEWKQHFDYLLPFFKDKRYIGLGGCPLLVIYKPEQIIMFEEMAKYWRKLAVKNGFSGLILMRQSPGIMLKELDYAIKFQPAMVWNYFDYDDSHMKRSKTECVKNFMKKIIISTGNEKLLQERKKRLFSDGKKYGRALRLFDYDDTWDIILNHQVFSNKLCSGAFTAWDNTARSRYGQLFLGDSPEKFEHYMVELLKKTSALDLVFINAWNEWAEGAYLEPDERNGYAYLEALKRAVDSQ